MSTLLAVPDSTLTSQTFSPTSVKASLLSGVTELFRWVADGDRALLDGGAGTLIVNPSRVDVAAHRKR